jgi:adenine specific DNA methylase Mod
MALDVMRRAEEAKRLLAGKPSMMGYRIFKYTKTYVGPNGRVYQNFFVKKRVFPFIWVQVFEENNGYHRRDRSRKTFNTLDDAKSYIISVQPPTEKIEEVQV